METQIYKGIGWNKDLVGVCKDNDIWSGKSWLNEDKIGRISDSGYVYRGTGWNENRIGCVKGNDVYSGTGWNENFVGSFSDGDIYSGRGLNKNKIGSYSGLNGAGAASALLLLKL